jgi:hypothetical protein
MGYLSRACLDRETRENMSNFYFEYKTFIENINSLLGVYGESVTEKFDQLSFSKFNINLNDKMIQAKLKKSQIDVEGNIISELNEVFASDVQKKGEGAGPGLLNFFDHKDVLKKKNPFFNDFNNFEE